MKNTSGKQCLYKLDVLWFPCIFFEGVSSFVFHSRKATKPEGPHLHKHTLWDNYLTDITEPKNTQTSWSLKAELIVLNKRRFSFGNFLSVRFSCIYSLPAYEWDKENRSALFSWYFWHFIFSSGGGGGRDMDGGISCYSKRNLLLFM